MLYEVITLYLYAGKILLAASWPKGGVAGYIIGFCGAGIATYVLVTPRRGREEFPLVRFFERVFWPLLVPLAALQFLAVWRRVSEYGLTESRYLGLVLSVWMVGVALYYLP